MLTFLRNVRRRRYLAALLRRGLKLGKNVYLNDGFFLDPAHCFLITIGDDVVFGPAVRVFAHDASSKKAIGKTKIGLVEIKRNAFVGSGSVILPGAVVGENSIIGANSTLSAEVPDNQVWAGSPARYVCSLEELREKLIATTGVDFDEDLYRLSEISEARKVEMIEKLKINGIGFIH